MIAAALMSAALILASPYTGQIRGVLRSNFPNHFVAIVGGTLALTLGAALVVALARVRERRATRFAAVTLALAIGTTYALASRTGIPEVDAVELVHFVEYGFVTFMFYRVWRHLGDISSFVLPVLAGVLVAILDEWLQWFIPARVGEARDVLLNLVAITCSLLFHAAIAAPIPFTRLRPGSATRLGTAAVAVLLVLAGFVDAVHLGHAISDARVGIFRSHYTAEELAGLAGERDRAWRRNPPMSGRAPLRAGVACHEYGPCRASAHARARPAPRTHTTDPTAQGPAIGPPGVQRRRAAPARRKRPVRRT